MSKKRQLVVILFIIYMAFVMWMTLLMREPRATERVFKPQLFWALRLWLNGVWNGKDEFIQYLQNIVFFIPFGFLFPIKKDWKHVLGYTVATSILIELIQYIFNLGWCELDDVISNTIGALIGFWIFDFTVKIYRKYRGRELCQLRKH